MPSVKITAKTLAHGVAELTRREPGFHAIVAEAGMPPLRHRPPGFGTLIHIICAQQVSTASARAIIGRLEAAVSPMTPENFLAFGEDALRGIGFSRQKARYGLGIAEAVVGGDLNLRKVARLPDEEAIAALIELKGVGRWTAEVYLLFALGRPDLWPVDDLGVVKGVMRLKGLDDKPTNDAMIGYGEAWRPWRSVAARLLWHSINAIPEA